MGIIVSGWLFLYRIFGLFGYLGCAAGIWFSIYFGNYYHGHQFDVLTWEAHHPRFNARGATSHDCFMSLLSTYGHMDGVERLLFYGLWCPLAGIFLGAVGFRVLMPSILRLGLRLATFGLIG